MSKYFSLKESVSKFKNEKGILNTAVNGTSILAKSIGNVGIFTLTTALPAIIEVAASSASKNPNLTSEQRDTIERNRENAEKLRNMRKD